METEIIRINPREIKLLEMNARYMEQDEYSRLVSNIKRDKKLTTVPFCYVTDDGTTEVLSGNHRVMASIDAGLDEIEVMLCKERLTQEQRIAIQLSHNSITGKDDKAILKKLYDSINAIDLKAYSGLCDELMKEYEKKLAQFKAMELDYQIVDLVFVPSEIRRLKDFFDQVHEVIKKNSQLFASFSDYDDYISLHADISKALCVKHASTAFLSMVELAKRHIDELKTVWLEKAKPGDYVPISTVVGRSDMTKKDAMVLDKAVQALISRGEIEKGKKEKALAVLASRYLNGA